MKPMLAATIDDISSIRFPLLASYKLDGIRCVLIQSTKTNKRLAASRTLKPIPNLFIRNTIERSSLPIGIDGELIVGNNFQDTASAVMSVAGDPVFIYHIFDFIGDGTHLSYLERYAKLKQLCYAGLYCWAMPLKQTIVNNLAELDDYEHDAIKDGAEGVILRSPESFYKFGRSTLKQQWLMKLKRFTDGEAQVNGFVELMHSTDPTKSKQGDLYPGNTLGALLVRDGNSGQMFSIGSGFSDAERRNIWRNKDSYLYQWVTYKYQNFGIKDKPRAPVFKRWRMDKNI